MLAKECRRCGEEIDCARVPSGRSVELAPVDVYVEAGDSWPPGIYTVDEGRAIPALELTHRTGGRSGPFREAHACRYPAFSGRSWI